MQTKKPIKIVRNLLNMHDESFNTLISSNICGFFGRGRYFMDPSHRKKFKQVVASAQSLSRAINHGHTSKSEKVRLYVTTHPRLSHSLLYLVLAIIFVAAIFLCLGNNLSIYKAGIFYVNTVSAVFFRLQKTSLLVQGLWTNALAKTKVYSVAFSAEAIVKMLTTISFGRKPTVGQSSPSFSYGLSDFFDKLTQYPVCQLDFWDNFVQIYSYCDAVIPLSVQRSPPGAASGDLPDPSVFQDNSGGLLVNSANFVSAMKEQIMNRIIQMSSGVLASQLGAPSSRSIVRSSVESSLRSINYGLFMTRFTSRFLVT